MSQSTVVACVLGCVQDLSYGYVAMLSRVAAMEGIDPGKIRTDFRFVRLRLPQTTLPANQPNVSVRAANWAFEGRNANLRDGIMTVEIAAEYFDADEEMLALNVDIGADAMASVIDGLRDYSDSINGPIIDTIDPVVIRSGTFEGAVSSGFIATVQLQERSAL